MKGLWREERDQIVFLYNSAHLCYSFIKFCPEDEKEYAIILETKGRLAARFSQLTECRGKLGMFGQIGLLFSMALEHIFDEPERDVHLDTLKQLFHKLSAVKTELLL